MLRRNTKRAQPLVFPHERKEKYPTTFWMRAASSPEQHYHEACMTKAAEVVRAEDPFASGGPDPYMESARIRTEETINLICHCMEKIEHCDPDGKLGDKIAAALYAGEKPQEDWLKGVTLTDPIAIRDYMNGNEAGINSMLAQAASNPGVLEQLRKPLPSSSSSGTYASAPRTSSMGETLEAATSADAPEGESMTHSTATEHAGEEEVGALSS